MHIIYEVINTTKLAKGEIPYKYIGSKSDYDGKYLGSSLNPLFHFDKNNGDVFELKILKKVEDKFILTKVEREIQKDNKVVEDEKYYNLVYAHQKFSTLGWKYYYDTLTEQRIFWPPQKPVPKTFERRQRQITKYGNISKEELNKRRSQSVKDYWKNRKRPPSPGNTGKGANYYVTDPNGVEHFVTTLTLWCRERKIDDGAIRRLASNQIKYYKGYNARKA